LPGARGNRRLECWQVGLAALLMAPVCAWPAAGGAEEGGRAPFRFAFSPSILTDVNEADARAAIKVWGQTVTRDRQIDADAEPRFISGVAAIVEAFRTHSIDAASMTTSEYLEVSKEVRLSDHLFATYAGRTEEEYLLLVHQDSRVSQLGDLAGKSLIVFRNPRASLAEAWLDTVLAKQSLSLVEGHFGKVTYQTKLARVVLPVFFKQADACLVHARGLKVMGELNPQVLKNLRAVVASPSFVPGLLCFRADYRPQFKQPLLRALESLRRTPAGQQILTLFQSDSIHTGPESNLQSAIELLKAHQRLVGAAARNHDGQPGASPARSGP
jgi:ABC-type phosphate/phosphonate transport system substrate-binding protein